MFSQTFEGCLFDMDGTLVDSSELVESTWAEFSCKYDLNFQSVVDYAHGRPTEQTVRKFLGDTAEAETETQRIVALEEKTTEGIRECPGAREFVEQMTRYRWGVVTSATRKLAENRLTAAGLPVPEILVTAEDVRLGKPNPEGFLTGARLLGVQPGSTLVFEDSRAGLQAGISGGFTTVRVGFGEFVPGEAGSLQSFEHISVICRNSPESTNCFALMKRHSED